MHSWVQVDWGVRAYRLEVPMVCKVSMIMVPDVYADLAELLPNGVEAPTRGWPIFERKRTMWTPGMLPNPS